MKVDPETETEVEDALTRVRDLRWRNEAREFALRSAVSEIQLKQRIFEFLGVAIAVGFLFIQYQLKMEDSKHHEWVALVGSSFAALLLILSFWAHISRWPGQVEHKQELGREIGVVARKLKTAQRDERDPGTLNELVDEAEDAIEEQLKDQLVRLSQSNVRAGFQHVAKENPAGGLQCHVCSTVWTSETIKTLRYRSFIPSIFKCANCGS